LLVGDSGDQILDEQTVPSHPAMQWRAKLEQDVIINAENKLNVVVIRPGWVYGGNGGHYIPPAIFTNPDKITIAGNPNKKWSWIHVDDLSDAYVRAGQRGNSVHGEVFNVSLDHGPTYQEVAKAASAAAGHKNAPVEIVKAEGWNEIQDINILLSSKKAEQLLGWKAKHLDFIDEMKTYYEAWKAHQTK